MMMGAGRETIEELKRALPSQGLFQGKSWRWSDRPVSLEAQDVSFLEGLGKKLSAFQRAADKLYRASVAGDAPKWVSEWLDLGKPEEVVRIGREGRGSLPRVLRPDLIRTDGGWALTEIDAVPGGVGLTAWLQEVYGKLDPTILGGTSGMRALVEEVLGVSGEVVISKEAEDYRPEWEWLIGKVNAPIISFLPFSRIASPATDSPPKNSPSPSPSAPKASLPEPAQESGVDPSMAVSPFFSNPTFLGRPGPPLQEWKAKWSPMPSPPRPSA